MNAPYLEWLSVFTSRRMNGVLSLRLQQRILASGKRRRRPYRGCFHLSSSLVLFCENFIWLKKCIGNIPTSNGCYTGKSEVVVCFRLSGRHHHLLIDVLDTHWPYSTGTRATPTHWSNIKTGKRLQSTNSIDCLLHVAWTRCLEIAANTTNAIEKLKPPRNITKLRNFVGLWNVFERSILGSARIDAPLSKDIKKPS